MKQPVFVYVDNSNIFHEGQRFAEKFRNEDRYGFRLHFPSFLSVLVSSEKPKEVVWGGSVPPPDDTVWSRLSALGVEPVLIPRGPGGENETVDNSIQLYMHRHVRKYRQSPGTIVLATGDGAGYHKEQGFLYDVEGFVKDGWALRLLSWRHSCHGKLQQFANANGEFVALDDFYDQFTFIEGGRRQV